MSELIDRYKQITYGNRRRQLDSIVKSDHEAMTQIITSQAVLDKVFSQYKSSEYAYWRNLTGGPANEIFNRIMAGA